MFEWQPTTAKYHSFLPKALFSSVRELSLKLFLIAVFFLIHGALLENIHHLFDHRGKRKFWS